VKWLANATPWIFRFVQDSKTGQPSVKRYGLALAVTVLAGVIIGLSIVIIILSVSSRADDKVEMMKMVCSTLENITFMFLATATGNYLVDKASARKADKNEQNP
jgi:hypothetical protein